MDRGRGGRKKKKRRRIAALSPGRTGCRARRGERDEAGSLVTWGRGETERERET